MVNKNKQIKDDKTFFFITFSPVFSQNFPFHFMDGSSLCCTSYDTEVRQHLRWNHW